jgi:hypothetical protein
MACTCFTAVLLTASIALCCPSCCRCPSHLLTARDPCVPPPFAAGCQVLSCMQLLVHFLDEDSPAAYDLVLPMLTHALDVAHNGEPELQEDGLLLWLVTLRAALAPHPALMELTRFLVPSLLGSTGVYHCARVLLGSAHHACPAPVMPAPVPQACTDHSALITTAAAAAAAAAANHPPMYRIHRPGHAAVQQLAAAGRRPLPGAVGAGAGGGADGIPGQCEGTRHAAHAACDGPSVGLLTPGGGGCAGGTTAGGSKPADLVL